MVAPRLPHDPGGSAGDGNSDTTPDDDRVAVSHSPGVELRLHSRADNHRFEPRNGRRPGRLIVGGLIEAAVGWLGIIGKVRKLFTPPLVTGVTITLIGFSLADVASRTSSTSTRIRQGGDHSEGNPRGRGDLSDDGLRGAEGKGGESQAMPVVVGAAVGYLLSVPLGLVDFGTVRDMPLVGIPRPFPWGAPVFDTTAVVLLLFAFMVSIIESVGDYHAIAAVTGSEITEGGRIARGGIGSEGLACSVAGVLGGACGTTSYSENIGVVALTRVGSRYVVQMGAVMLVLLSLLPKFAGGVLASMPAPVLGGLTWPYTG